MNGRSSLATRGEFDVIMLVLNDVTHDGRVQREAAALAADGRRVLVMGIQRADGQYQDREMLRGFQIRRVRFGRWGSQLWRPWRWFRHALQVMAILRALKQTDARVYHGHDWHGYLVLLVFCKLWRRDARLVYDVHDLFLFQFRFVSRVAQRWHRLTLPYFMWIEGWAARRADGVITVSDPAARVLRLWYGIRDPLVIMNASDPVKRVGAAAVDLRAVVGPGKRIVVHSGDIAQKRRSLSELIEALAMLPDDVVLVLMGQDVDGGAVRLRDLAARLGMGNRVAVLPPVAPEMVAPVIQAADASAILVRPESFNSRAPLPNKLFEAIAAGLPVVASDVFALRRVVRGYGLGRLCDPNSPASIAAALIDVLDPTLNAENCRACVVAQGTFNAEREMGKLRTLYAELLR